ncbi:hypothetical protein BO70DRAFT_308701 [Aspergillus heteromorphus CBS 117.55]|uniref:Uncharacterized protein n=1 Tax=Aspergillus heteromorphus CBS 117.55 TaxID=1448321 RepID=A0A317WUW1_9EURO|nr:uncharacterized protein BO70DRAFT_308701 [Aspergillus heteromorphus CBS 117.55]PWY90139.1 hypothetical protein BO70DRAFT_308701 [Aspergillus heteromorphus CBS 117.55]
MSPTTDGDSTEDVNDFLLRIRQLGEKRDKEDEERTKKLEEEILQGRKERQARRAERARSISPTKDSPILDPTRFSMSSLSQRAIDPPEHLEPTLHTPSHDAGSRTESIRDDASITTDGSRRGSALTADGEAASKPLSPLRSRTGTLSWQQRPTSRDSNRAFFSSSSPTREGRFRGMSTTSSDDHGAFRSRSPFTSSPSFKDVPWSRPTEGSASSPTRTKNAEEYLHHTLAPDTDTKEEETDHDHTTEPVKETEHQEVEERSRSPSRASSTVAESSLGHRYSSISSVSTATGLGSPLPLSGIQKLEPTKAEESADDQTSSPSSPRRLSPERSTSPTKGLGGFVQSAMMKRSDSVSKRWSAQIPSGRSRGDSFASNRNSFAAPSGFDIFSTAPSHRPGSSHRPDFSNRPSSSHSEATVVHPTKDFERPDTPPVPNINDARLDEGVARPSLSLHTRSASSVEKGPESGSLPPTSPAVSRTMDPKRWSPTKATWLESALNRPDSPRHKRQQSQQTSWAKDRQSRASVDLGRTSSFKEVTPVGLMRTAIPSAHSKTSSVSGIPDIFANQEASKVKEEEPEPSSQMSDLKADSTESDPPPVEKSPEPTPLEEASPIKSEASPTKSEATPTKSEAESENVDDDSAKHKRTPSTLNSITKTTLEAPLPSPRDPLLNRPKPQSPVIDFRANLRRREIVKDDAPKAEPEFKNIFNRLKKAESSTYVAPDKLRENILMGKAALNATNGPLKSTKVDELKDSLLKQKDAIKASGGSLRRNTLGENDAPVKAIPEAIAMRNSLARPSSIKSNRSVADPSSPLSPREPDTPRSAQDMPLPSPLSAGQHIEEPEAAEPSKPDVSELQTAVPEPDLLSDEKENENETDSNPLEKADNEEQPSEEAIKPVRSLTSGDSIETAGVPAVTESPAAKGTLAGRINPALAGLFSRPRAPMDESSNGSSINGAGGSRSESSESQPAAPLTHMTKDRARGPKRRLPKGTTSEGTTPEEHDTALKPLATPPKVQEPEASSVPDQKSVGVSSGWPLPDTEISPIAESPTVPGKPDSPAIGRPVEFKRSIPRLGEREPVQKPRAAVDQFSPQNGGNANEYLRNLRSSLTSKPPLPPKSAPLPPIPTHNQSRSSPIHFSSPSPSPSPLRSSYRENQNTPPGPGQRASSFFASLGARRNSSPRDKALPSPPVPPKGSRASVRSSVSLVPQADESWDAISGFFKTFPNSSDRVDIDTQLMLEDRSDKTKIRTVKKQIWEITGDGKKQDLPVNQEYIMYEGSMYLCTHTFEADGSTRSEVHLWCGDDVPDAAVDDALSFSRKIAKESGCKLEIIKQGKEPARFIQALGGILITRRGSSSRSSSSAIFMLCGRKHLGQMVFDEVNFSPSSLCSGYPFVISAMFGKLFLWKGKGSSAEEIGAARLIGMDLGLTGEFEEVAENEEPESFFEVFPRYEREPGDNSMESWRLKSNNGRYRSRLFRVDHELGQRSGFWLRSPSPVVRPNDTVQAIEPFCQNDITPKGVYVLDTFFEIYVIVGEQASNRPAEFASAVYLAHEYGILAASLQDRPFIPKSFFSLGGIPEACSSAFRKWVPGSRLPQVFPLNAAIEAIRST